MKKTAISIGFFILGLLGYIALICSISAACVTNEALMKEGFRQFSEARHLEISPTEYDAYATALIDQMKGKTENALIADPDNAGQMKNAFSDKENLHMQDVRRIINGLLWLRYAGGGIVLSLLAAMYLFGKKNRSSLFFLAWRGFSQAALALLLIASSIAIWGLCDFSSLFQVFHQVFFSNDLWLLDPETDLLVALMPLRFFTWYGGILLKNLLPILGVMLCVVISWLRLGKKETKKSF